MGIEDKEWKPDRKRLGDTVIGRKFSRTYNIGPEAYAVLPSYGDVMPGYGTESDETETSALVKPYVSSIAHKLVKGQLKTVITYVQAVAYPSGVSATHYVEVRGSRRESTLDNARVITSLGVSDDGTNIPATGDLFTGDSGLTARRCTHVREDPHAVPGLIVVTGTWVQLIEDKRKLKQISRHRWRGTRSFLRTYTEAISESQRLYYQTWPSMSGQFAPKVRETNIDFEPDGVPGVARLLAFYRSAGGGNQTEPGQARLFIDISGTPERRLKDKDGKVIEGPDGTAYGLNEYRVVEGTNDTLRRRCMLRLDTAYPKTGEPIANIMRLYDSVNDHDLPKFGNAKKGTLRFFGEKTQREVIDDLVYYSFFMGFEPDGWNNILKSRRGCWVLKTEKQIDVDGTVSTTEELIKRFVPDQYIDQAADGTFSLKDSKKEDRAPFPEADWGALHTLTLWNK